MQVCDQVYNPRTDEYEEYCYDDGSNESGGGVFDYEPAEYSETGPWESWGDAPGEGSNTVVDSSTGNITYKYDDGSTLTVDRNGNPVGNTESSDAKGNSAAFNRTLSWATKTLGPTAGKVLSNVMANPGASLMTAIAAAKAFGGSDKQGGYNKPVPKLDAVRQQIQYNDPNRVAGSAGRQYFTDPKFVKEGDDKSMTAAQAADAAQAKGILAAYKPAAAPAANPWASKMQTKWNTPAPAATSGTTTAAGLAAIPTQEQLMNPNYKIGMASGGIASGRYLQGETDGMADEIPSSIDGDQPAALSHGEFVIPADVVSHLGNGNSDAGAKKLY